MRASASVVAVERRRRSKRNPIEPMTSARAQRERQTRAPRSRATSPRHRGTRARASPGPRPYGLPGRAACASSELVRGEPAQPARRQPILRVDDRELLAVDEAERDPARREDPARVRRHRLDDVRRTTTRPRARAELLQRLDLAERQTRRCASRRSDSSRMRRTPSTPAMTSATARPMPPARPCPRSSRT